MAEQLDLDAKLGAGPKVFSVSEVVALATQALEQCFGAAWVEGEVSNLSTPASGHVYFTLKDASAQMSAVLWRSDARRLRFRLQDGMRLRCHGRLAIYGERGKFQMYVDRAEPDGVGALQLAFEQLKERLAAEGLFDQARKRPPPFLPRTIGVVTSPTGAAVRDFVRVATRRYPARILIAPASVQGDDAPLELVRALGWLQAREDVDVVVVTRGGGSIEDLWAFNDERVARAIAAFPRPVISAVGHEVDFTIADFVADVRAATPSAAGERVVPEREALLDLVMSLRGRLARAASVSLREARQRADDALGRQEAALRRGIARRRQALALVDSRLAALHPRGRLTRDRARLCDAFARVCAASARQLASRRARFAAAAATLDALSPLRVLDRGYSLVRGPDGRLLTDAAEVAPGDRVDVRLRSGLLACLVEKTGRHDHVDDP
ncbi:MAG: exodeoxyribonuclease VII large subunit [Myxococcota bacterium]